MKLEEEPKNELNEYKSKFLLVHQSIIFIINFSISALPLKFNKTDTVFHHIFLKKFRSDKKSAARPIGKTLNVLNIPPFATEESIKNVFSIVGPVQSVKLIDSIENDGKDKYEVKTAYFNDRPASKFQIGFVVFKKSESLDLVFRLKELPPLNSSDLPLLTGVAKWTAEYNQRTIDTVAMQAEIDQYLQHYDKVKKAEAEGVEDEEDEEGWTTVTRTGHNSGFKQKESVINKLEQKILDKKKQTKQLTNFYTFEMRENKKQHFIDLKKKYQDDRFKMDSLKQTRRFKPF